jgi:hypothetical protein
MKKFGFAWPKSFECKKFSDDHDALCIGQQTANGSNSGKESEKKGNKDGWLLWEIAPAIVVLIGLLIRKKNRLSDRKIVPKQLLSSAS